MGLPCGRRGRRLSVRLGLPPLSARRRAARPAGRHAPPARRWLPGPLADALGWLRRVPRPVLAGVLAVVLVAGLVVAQEVAAAGQVRRGVRVGGVELSGLTRVAATERLRAAAEALQASPLALQAGDATVPLARSKAGVELDVEASVAAAMDVGRGGPFDADRFKGWFGRIDLPWKARVETARLNRGLAAPGPCPSSWWPGGRGGPSTGTGPRRRCWPRRPPPPGRRSASPSPSGPPPSAPRPPRPPPTAPPP